MRKDGYWAGYSDYRYGSKLSLESLNKKVKARGKSEEIIRRDRREHIVSQVMDILDDFRDSPWGNEGATRSSLRGSLCLLGHDWDSSDLEAAAIVDAAFRRLGRGIRPSWREGQWQLILGPDYCANCGRGLSDKAIGQRWMYCGPICAKAALEAGAYEGRVCEDQISRNAWKIFRTTQTAPRKCKCCGEEFRVYSESRENRYCSKRCRDQSLRTRELRACQHCQKPFLPSLAINKFCSMACSSAAGRETKYIHTCQAPNCTNVFASALPYSKYCSGACNARAHYHRKKAATAPACDRMCDCGRMFTPTVRQSKKISCGECDRPMKKRETATIIKLPLPLTAAIFDQMFGRAA